MKASPFGVSDSGSSLCHHITFLSAAKSQVVLPHTFSKKEKKIEENV